MIKVQLVRLLPLFLAASLSLISSLAYAQFGEVAGQLFTNVSVGSTNTVTFTLVNSGATPIRFEIVPPPTFRSSTSNSVPPTVTASPMNGTMAPSTEFRINVTVYVPNAKNNTPGTQWIGVIQAIVLSNSSSTLSGSGANIQEGVAKIITITAQAPQPSILPYAIGGVVAVALIGGGAFYLSKRRKAKAPKRAVAGARASSRGRKRVASKAVRRKAVRRTAGKAKPRSRRRRKSTRRRRR